VLVPRFPSEVQPRTRPYGPFAELAGSSLFNARYADVAVRSDMERADSTVDDLRRRLEEAVTIRRSSASRTDIECGSFAVRRVPPSLPTPTKRDDGLRLGSTAGREIFVEGHVVDLGRMDVKQRSPSPGSEAAGETVIRPEMAKGASAKPGALEHLLRGGATTCG
jgi:hypothetical protein